MAHSDSNLRTVLNFIIEYWGINKIIFPYIILKRFEIKMALVYSLFASRTESEIPEGIPYDSLFEDAPLKRVYERLGIIQAEVQYIKGREKCYFSRTYIKHGPPVQVHGPPLWT